MSLNASREREQEEMIDVEDKRMIGYEYGFHL